MNGQNKDPFACKLASHLVKVQFGDLCEASSRALQLLTLRRLTTCCGAQVVCSALLDKGISSAVEIGRCTGECEPQYGMTGNLLTCL